jgi:HAD superfamily phosphoserine phosphatase-like hydrolase
MGCAMAKTKVFISSTYVDMQDLRSEVASFFENIGFEPFIFEQGTLYYDPKKTLINSCMASIKECNIFILVIGKRYGSSVQDLSGDCRKRSKENVSITKAEYQCARKEGIPIYIFIKSEVMTELETYRKQPADKRQEMEFAHVDSVYVLKFIDEIFEERPRVPTFMYKTVDDVTSCLKKQLDGMVSDYLASKQKKKKALEKVPVNSYKLFYFRDKKEIKVDELSMRVGVDKKVLRKLEAVKEKENFFDLAAFPKCEVGVVDAIEEALNCRNKLRAGSEDDFLSLYISYYKTYRNTKRKKIERSSHLRKNVFNTKAVVFDFDGTLTKNSDDKTTWERMWKLLGYNLNECAKYHKEFSDKRITHEKWCMLTLEKFKERGFTSSNLQEIASGIELIDGVEEVVNVLLGNKIKIYILSGSVKQIIENVLGDISLKFDEIRANELHFDHNGLIKNIIGTHYDFEGKAEFIKRIIRSNKFMPLEVLFVGNSCNDIWASQSGASTLCVNPHFADPHNTEHWTYALREMKNLKDIFDYINIE